VIETALLILREKGSLTAMPPSTLTENRYAVCIGINEYQPTAGLSPLRYAESDAKADQDPDIRQAAQALLDQMKAVPGGEQHVQNAIGTGIAQADRGSTASVTINHIRDKEQ
jgi:hypothetical protein